MQLECEILNDHYILQTFWKKNNCFRSEVCTNIIVGILHLAFNVRNILRINLSCPCSVGEPLTPHQNRVVPAKKCKRRICAVVRTDTSQENLRPHYGGPCTHVNNVQVLLRIVHHPHMHPWHWHWPWGAKHSKKTKERTAPPSFYVTAMLNAPNRCNSSYSSSLYSSCK